jgi:pimeloyl-ACP methyl ester carboxylesterase
LDQFFRFSQSDCGSPCGPSKQSVSFELLKATPLSGAAGSPGLATSCSKFALTGRPTDLYGGTAAGARELFFGDKTSDRLVSEATARLQPDSTRAILFDMVALELVKTARITTPLLVLGGERDAIYRGSDVHATAKTYGTRAAFIPDMGHEMMLEPGWATVAGHILSWLEERGL